MVKSINLYNNFNIKSTNNNNLFNECRSMVIDLESKKVISYTHDNIKYTNSI